MMGEVLLVDGAGPRSRLLELCRKVPVLVVENIGPALKVIVVPKTVISTAMVMMSARKERGYDVIRKQQ